MIFTDFGKALGQLGDPRFLRVVAMGLGLSLLLLIAVYAGVVTLIGWLVPDSVTLPWIGAVSGVDALLSVGSIFVMIGVSVFLMVPVAALFSGLFLESVADAVEDRHYPGLPETAGLSLGESLKEALGFFGLLVVANLLALMFYLFAGPLAPLVFWAVNGFLLGREYFTLVALRRLGRAQAAALRARFGTQIWLAGALMSVPLSVPVLNLIVPVLGVATFTHMFTVWRHSAKGKGGLLRGRPSCQLTGPSGAGPVGARNCRSLIVSRPLVMNHTIATQSTKVTAVVIQAFFLTR